MKALSCLPLTSSVLGAAISDRFVTFGVTAMFVNAVGMCQNDMAGRMRGRVETWRAVGGHGRDNGHRSYGKESEGTLGRVRKRVVHWLIHRTPDCKEAAETARALTG